MNRIWKDMMRASADREVRGTWDLLLPSIQHAFNSSVHAGSKTSPFDRPRRSIGTPWRYIASEPNGFLGDFSGLGMKSPETSIQLNLSHRLLLQPSSSSSTNLYISAEFVRAIIIWPKRTKCHWKLKFRCVRSTRLRS
jgi:hypothetical protein